MTYISFSNVLLGAGIFLTIAGISIAFSRKERERVQKRVMAELPDRATRTGSAEALRIYQRRGYIMLVLGILFVALWFAFYGL